MSNSFAISFFHENLTWLHTYSCDTTFQIKFYWLEYYRKFDWKVKRHKRKKFKIFQRKYWHVIKANVLHIYMTWVKTSSFLASFPFSSHHAMKKRPLIFSRRWKSCGKIKEVGWNQERRSRLIAGKLCGNLYEGEVYWKLAECVKGAGQKEMEKVRKQDKLNYRVSLEVQSMLFAVLSLIVCIQSNKKNVSFEYYTIFFFFGLFLSFWSKLNPEVKACVVLCYSAMFQTALCGFLYVIVEDRSRLHCDT